MVLMGLVAKSSEDPLTRVRSDKTLALSALLLIEVGPSRLLILLLRWLIRTEDTLLMEPFLCILGVRSMFPNSDALSFKLIPDTDGVRELLREPGRDETEDGRPRDECLATLRYFGYLVIHRLPTFSDHSGSEVQSVQDESDRMLTFSCLASDWL